MKQVLAITEVSNFAVRPGTTKSFFVGEINGEQQQIMVSEAVKASLTKLAKQPQKAAEFILESCQIQISEQGKMISLAPKLGKALFTFSGTLRK